MNDLLLRRRILMTKINFVGYQRLEWIESAGNSYFTVQHFPKHTNVFATTVAVTINANTIFWGVRSSGTSSGAHNCYFGANLTGVQRFRVFTLWTKSTSEFDQSRSWKTDYIPSINTLYTFENMFCVDDMVDATRPVVMFGFDNAGTINSTVGACRIGWWRVSDNGTILYDLYACKRLSDNKVGMYDVIGKHFYTTEGTREFTAGPSLI